MVSPSSKFTPNVMIDYTKSLWYLWTWFIFLELRVNNFSPTMAIDVKKVPHIMHLSGIISLAVIIFKRWCFQLWTSSTWLMESIIKSSSAYANYVSRVSFNNLSPFWPSNCSDRAVVKFENFPNIYHSIEGM